MSQKPIWEKLGIKESYRIALVNGPRDYRSKLGELPTDVTVTEPEGPLDLVQVFVTSGEELETQLRRVKLFLAPRGLLWVTYPKGASKTKTEINRDSIREYAKTLGFQAVAMISIDETWSALRLKVAG